MQTSKTPLYFPAHVPECGRAWRMAGLRLSAPVLLVLVLSLTGLPFARAGLPPGWSDTDTGSPADAGSASDDNGAWTVSGGGADIWGTADQRNFASHRFNCGGAIIAQVTSVQNTDPGSGGSKAGVMFWNDTAAGAVNAFMAVTATQGVNFQFRTTAGTASSSTQVARVATPVWVKVVRTSDL